MASMAIDPVCGMNVEPAKAAGSFDYQGRTHLFCSRGCLARFTAEPERYVGRAEAAPPAAEPGGGKYTCPMHPEVVQVGRVVPEVRHGARAGGGRASRGGERGAARHDAPVRRRRRVERAAPAQSPWGRTSASPSPSGSRRACAATWSSPSAPRSCCGAAGRSSRGSARAREPQPELYTLIASASRCLPVQHRRLFLPGIFPAEFRGEGGMVGSYFEAAA